MNVTNHCLLLLHPPGCWSGTQTNAIQIYIHTVYLEPPGWSWIHVGLQVLTALPMKSMTDWVLTLCSSDRVQCFAGTYHLHLQDGLSHGNWYACNRGTVYSAMPTQPTWCIKCLWDPRFPSTVEPPFEVHQFKVFPHLNFKFSDHKSTISVLNFAHLRFYSVWCWNPFVPKRNLKRDFRCWEDSHCGILGYDTIQSSMWALTFQTNILPASSLLPWNWLPPARPHNVIIHKTTIQTATLFHGAIYEILFQRKIEDSAARYCEHSKSGNMILQTCPMNHKGR
jgi:hypothetical protein